MHRRKFITNSIITAFGATIPTKIMSNQLLNHLTQNTPKMPVLFMGHGNPMNAIEDNQFTKAWHQLAKNIPTPKAIVIISAHWETKGETQVFVGEKPKMIYDMYGFPQKLYEVKYPVQGNPELAKEIQQKVNYTSIALNHNWGLDHGAWSVLVKMFPEATIPCFQLSLNTTRDLQWHYDFAKQLAFLRNKGVLIMGSGNIVHNLRYIHSFNDPAPDWALEFDQKSTQFMNEGNHQALINYEKLGKAALISINSAEHYIPLLYALALQEKGDEISYTNQLVDNTLLGVGMRCVRVG